MRRWRAGRTGRQAVRYDRELEVFVDRVEARFAAWYEMFHRSQGKVPGKSATFADCEERLPEIKAMGFDVIYFVPIHPIGRAAPQGAEQRADGRARRSRQPLRHRLGRGRTQGDQPGARHARRLPPLRPRLPRAGHGGGARLRHPVRAGPSVDQGASRLVHLPARRHHQVRREPAEEVPGHRQRQLLRRRTRKRCGRSCCRSSCSGSSRGSRSSASTTRTPSRCRSGNG